MNLNQEYVNKLLETLSIEEISEILNPQDLEVFYRVIEEKYIIPFMKGVFIRNADGSYDIQGSIDYSLETFTRLPVTFNKVTRDFSCSCCYSLQSLKGVPRIVGGNFDCSFCEIETLEWGPSFVGGFYDCSDCKKLKSLKGAPNELQYWFSCAACISLLDLTGAPKKLKSFFCSECRNLKSLKGGPVKVLKDFNCSRCSSLESLEGAPQSVGVTFICDLCKVKFTEEYVRSLCIVGKSLYL